jgi:hypothetical protein
MTIDHPIHLLFWPVCWPPVWHCCLLWPAPWPSYSSYKFDLYISNLFVDSNLNVDLLCDIVVSCDLLHDHLFLIQFWPVCWFWPECWPPVWHCCILWPAPHTILTCMLILKLTSYVTFFCVLWPAPWPSYSSYNSDLYVDSDLYIDLLCDIVVLVLRQNVA